jgi:hypothetical protein
VNLHVSYFSEKNNVTLKNDVVGVKAFQIIVWVSVALRKPLEWDPRIPKVPAILDIGKTHNFALTRDGQEFIRTSFLNCRKCGNRAEKACSGVQVFGCTPMAIPSNSR